MASLWRRLPVGALYALLVVASFHVAVACWFVPHPVARASLRHKVIALTEHDRPSLLIAGDSRAEWQVIPAVVSDAARVPVREIVNIAGTACESSAVRAVYREFSGRFAPQPIMLVCLSAWSVNDRSVEGAMLSEETLWSLGFRERLNLVSFPRALSTIFSPERAWGRRLTEFVCGTGPVDVLDRGFSAIPESSSVRRTPEWTRTRIARIDEAWFGDAVFDGVRWRLMERDLEGLQKAGVQIVVLDPPMHPVLIGAMAGTSMGAADAQFHRQLRELCGRLRVPLLQYDNDCFGEQDPGAYYDDLLHLNPRGAEVFSACVGRDLSTLIDQGVLKLPSTERDSPAQGPVTQLTACNFR
ncbi:MAG: SGNH/GDSL hydrolase family protein [bacterium]|nr:SGNH/GDSL hydrolase family protein [bacterium]